MSISKSVSQCVSHSKSPAVSGSISKGTSGEFWLGKVYFSPDQGNSNGSFHEIAPKELYEKMKELDGLGCLEKIVHFWNMKEDLEEKALFWEGEDQILLFHQYVIFETENHHFWSFEKDCESIVVQRSTTFSSLSTTQRKRSRWNVHKIHERPIICDITILDLFAYLKEEKEFDKSYSVVFSNCKHFAKRIDDFLRRSEEGETVKCYEWCGEQMKQLKNCFKTFTIHVSLPGHFKKHLVSVTSDNTVNRVLEYLASLEGLPLNLLELYFGQTRLDKEKTLKHYGVRKNSSLFLLVGVAQGNARDLMVKINDQNDITHPVQLRANEPVGNVMMLLEGLCSAVFNGSEANAKLMFGPDSLDASRTLESYGISKSGMFLNVMMDETGEEHQRS